MISHQFKVFAAAAIAACSLHAADPFIGDGMADKGTHGLVNVASGWMEIPNHIKSGYDDGIEGMTHKKPALSRTLGTFRGVFTGAAAGVGRTFTGAFQLAGFWSADHVSNEGVGNHLGKEYAWEKTAPPEATTSADRVRNRGARGLTDLTLGTAEIPVQIDKTYTADHQVDSGFTRGVWFATSRVYGGVYDLVGFMIPGCKETYGYAYDSVHPLGDDD